MMIKSFINRIYIHFYNRIKEIRNKKIIIGIKNRLSINNILPTEINNEEYCCKINFNKNKSNKYKIGIIHSEPYMYNMIHSLYNTFEIDNRIDVDIIISEGEYLRCANYLKERRIPYRYDFECVEEEYDAILDICIHVSPNSNQLIIRNNSRFCFAVPSNEYNPDFIMEHINTLIQWKPDAIFCERSHVNNCAQKIEISMYDTGNPKYDLIYETCHNNFTLPVSFQKINKKKFKKTFLYITDHAGEKVSPAVSFDLYAKTLFKFFYDHQDYCMIFRPYTSYLEENIRNGYWTRKDVDILKEYCIRQKNIIWDEEDSDAISLSLADAIISDVGCGITTHALPIMKPIGVPLRWDIDCSSEIGDRKAKESCYYFIESEFEMLSFLEMVISGLNEKEEGMKRRMNDMVTNYDGNISERIKDIIMGYIEK